MVKRTIKTSQGVTYTVEYCMTKQHLYNVWNAEDNLVYGDNIETLTVNEYSQIVDTIKSLEMQDEALAKISRALKTNLL